MTVAVTLEGVSCVFGSGAQTVRAVDHVDLTIEEGEFFTLLGPSGSGKTTCLRMIGGFTLPTSGRILIGGEDVSHLPPYARPVNTVFQDYALFPHMNIRDNVAYGLMVQGVEKAQRHARAEQMLDLVRLSGVGTRRPGQLSGGQRQRVALARAVFGNPRLLVLDEPNSNLDSIGEKSLGETIVTMRDRGSIVILITHRMNMLTYCDDVLVLNAGTVHTFGPKEHVLERLAGFRPGKDTLNTITSPPMMKAG